MAIRAAIVAAICGCPPNFAPSAEQAMAMRAAQQQRLVGRKLGPDGNPTDNRQSLKPKRLSEHVPLVTFLQVSQQV